MRKTIVLGLTALAFAAVLYAGGDPWKKPYQQWDQKDVAKVLNDSPWCKRIAVVVTWRPDMGIVGAAGAPSSAAPNPAASNGRQPTGGAGGAGPDSGPAEAPFLVRWVSSRTFREATLRNDVLGGKMKQEDAEKNLEQTSDTYEIAIYAQDTTPFQSADETALKNSSFLMDKKTKQKIPPSNVSIQRDAGGKKVSVIAFVFPKKTPAGEPTIADDEKSVDFSCEVGGAKIKTNFEVSKMQDTKGRDL